MCSLYHTAIVKTTMAQWNNRIHIQVQWYLQRNMSKCFNLF